MLDTFFRSWALLLGILLLMMGNGIQGTLLGIRGDIEGFSTFEISLVMSAYFAGFLGGSRFAPDLIRRVGHVRVFAALGSFISAIFVLFPVVTEPAAWIALRVAMGFCFSGVYVTAESWLNNAATNATRGKALALYMIMQMVGIVAAQGLLTLGDPSGYTLFILSSVLVSVAFAPILLSASPTPTFATTKPMGLVALFRIAPLSCVSVFLLGGVFSAIFGMAAVYGTAAGLSVAQISTFVATIYVGGMLCQFPIGYVSDRMDRRRLILLVVAMGLAASAIGIVTDNFTALLVAAFFIGGTANPLYGLVIAYANDHLQPEDMASASGRMLFLNGIGASGGPILTGWLIGVFGPGGFFVFLAGLMALMLGYGTYRSFRREAPSDTGGYVAVGLTSTAVAIGAAQDYHQEAAEGDAAHDPAPGDNAIKPEEIEDFPPQR